MKFTSKKPGPLIQTKKT